MGKKGRFQPLAVGGSPNSTNSTDSSGEAPHGSRDMEPSLMVLEKRKTKGELMSTPTDTAQAIGDLNRRFDRMETWIKEVLDVVKDFKDSMGVLTSRVEKMEETAENIQERLGSLEKDKNDWRKEKQEIMDKMDHMENFNRRNNVRIIGLKEGTEGRNIVEFFQKWIPEVLGKDRFKNPLKVERAHRTFGPRRTPDQRPRPVLVRLLSCRDREEILRAAAARARETGGPLEIGTDKVFFFQDLSAALVRRRKEFDAVKKQLRVRNIPYSMLYPATLRLEMSEGGRRFFATSREAEDFVRGLRERS